MGRVGAIALGLVIVATVVVCVYWLQQQDWDAREVARSGAQESDSPASTQEGESDTTTIKSVPFKDDSQVEVRVEFEVDDQSPVSKVWPVTYLPARVKVRAAVDNLPDVKVLRPDYCSGRFFAPASSRRVRFEAAGYDAVSVDWPIPVGGIVDLGVIRFRLAGTLAILVVGVPPDAPFRFTVRCQLDAGGGTSVGPAHGEAINGKGRVLLQIPPSKLLSVTVTGSGGDRGAIQPFTKQFPPMTVGAGETVLVNLSALSWFTLLIQDLPSVEYNPIDVLLRKTGVRGLERDARYWHIAEVSNNGRVAFGLRHRVLFTAEITLREGAVPLAKANGGDRVFSEPDRGRIDVHPTMPVVAVGLCEDDRHLIDRPFAVFPPGIRSTPETNRNGFQLVTSKTVENPDSILAMVGESDRRLADCSLHWPKADVMEVSVSSAKKDARVVFRWSESQEFLVSARLHHRDDRWIEAPTSLSVTAASADTEQAVFPAVPPGEYRLLLGFRSKGIYRRSILPKYHRFLPGENRELTIEVPKIKELLVIVVNWESMPALMRPTRLKLGGYGAHIREGEALVMDLLEESPRIRFTSPMMPEPAYGQGRLRSDGRTIEVEFPVETLAIVEVLIHPAVGGDPFLCRSSPRDEKNVQVAIRLRQYRAAPGEPVKLIMPRDSCSVFNVWERIRVGPLSLGQRPPYLFRGQLRIEREQEAWVIGPEGRELKIRVPDAWGKARLVVKPEGVESKAHAGFLTPCFRVENHLRAWIPADAASLRITCSGGRGEQVTRDVSLRPWQVELDLR